MVKKLVLIGILVCLTSGGFFDLMPSNSCVYAQKKDDKRDNRKQPSGPPIVRDKRDNPPPKRPPSKQK